MNWTKKLRDAVSRNKSKTSVVMQEKTGQICVNPLCSAYENVFSQVRVLVDEMKVVRPYGIGRNGATLPMARTPELAMLECPNEEMGWAEFADLMFLMWLTEKELNIHVHKDGRGRIAGYSILPVGCRTVEPGTGRNIFQVYSVNGGYETLTDGEVMTLRYSRNPMNIDEGVSPAVSVEVYAQIADVIAQYQKAWFENGATPASVTFIKAKTRADFEQKKDAMQRELHGAKNKNKTIFIYRSVLDDGEAADEVEIKPIQANNSTMAIKEIMSIVNDEINRAFGVSPFLMGDDSSAKYDNAELSDRQFTKRRVKPALDTFWSQFQHELDRVFGGIGYAIGYELEIPELTDRLKVKAEIAKTEAETAKSKRDQEKVVEETKAVTLQNLQTVIAAGVSVDNALEALGLSREWAGVANDLFAVRLAEANKEEISTVEVAPEMVAQVEEPVLTEVHTHDCKHCHKHTTTDAEKPYEPSFTKDEVVEQGIYEELVKVLQSAINEALGEGVVLTDEELEKLKQAIATQLIAQADAGANDAVGEIEGYLLGATAKEVAGVLENGGYHLGDSFAKRMQERVDTLVKGLSDAAKAKVQEVLNPFREQGLSQQEIAKQLSDVMPKFRAELIARNETVDAFRAGGLENMKELSKKYSLKVRKVWICHPDDRTCPICLAMDGQTVDLFDAFPDTIQSEDGETYGWEHTVYNDKGELADAHVNCRCTIHYEVVDD